MRWFRDTRDPAIIVSIDESDSSAEDPAIRKWLSDLAAKGRDPGAPMTGPGGRWRPVSELFERDAQAAEEPLPDVMRRIDEWLENGRWEQ